MIQFQENARTDGRTGGWKGGLTLFHRTLPATGGGPKKTIKLRKSIKEEKTITNITFQAGIPFCCRVIFGPSIFQKQVSEIAL